MRNAFEQYRLSQDEGARDTLKSLKDKEKELGEVKDLLQKKEKEAVSRLEEKVGFMF